jgi:hypothetical protein
MTASWPPENVCLCTNHPATPWFVEIENRRVCIPCKSRPCELCSPNERTKENAMVSPATAKTAE